MKITFSPFFSIYVIFANNSILVQSDGPRVYTDIMGGRQMCVICFLEISSFLGGWVEAETTWYVDYYLLYCTNPRWRMVMSVENSVDWLVGQTEVPWGNLYQCWLSNTSPISPDPHSNSDGPGGKLTTDLLSYGTAYSRSYVVSFFSFIRPTLPWPRKSWSLVILLYDKKVKINNNNSVVLVRERIIQTERLPLVG
jgi:hypothetical protein